MKIPKIVPPPVLFLLCLIAGSIAHRWQPRAIVAYRFEAGLIAGCALLAVAFATGSLAWREMRRHRTPLEPWAEPRRLVTSGPFRFSRNPLYVALVTTLTAIAVMVNSLWLLASAALLAVLLDRLVIVREEAILGRVFGDAYRDYRARVRRWF